MAEWTKNGSSFIEEDVDNMPGTSIVAADDLLKWEGYMRVVDEDGAGTDGAEEREGEMVWVRHHPDPQDIEENDFN